MERDKAETVVEAFEEWITAISRHSNLVQGARAQRIDPETMQRIENAYTNIKDRKEALISAIQMFN